MKLPTFILLLVLAFPGSAFAAPRKAKADPAIAAMAMCSAEKNAGDVAWAYMLQSGQSGLTGPALDGANAYALFLMVRDCAPGPVSFDNRQATALSDRAFAAWGGDRAKRSAARSIDAWADCLVEHEPARARGYLAARDMGFAGPKIIVNGIDPIDAIFDPSDRCDGIRPGARASINLTDLYARLNYRLRVEPRLEPAPAVSSATSEKS